MKRVLAALAVLILIGCAGTAISMRSTADDPAIWHVDPATSERTGKPNDYLVAPDGLTAAPADQASRVFAMPPEDLLFLFDSVVRPSSGVSVVGGAVEERWITYVQRSAVIGFPDYISVKAVEQPGGSALIIWSRSRYGYSDLGVNRKRVEEWLAQVKAP